jgi:hypothetical protein
MALGLRIDLLSEAREERESFIEHFDRQWGALSEEERTRVESYGSADLVGEVF